MLHYVQREANVLIYKEMHKNEHERGNRNETAGRKRPGGAAELRRLRRVRRGDPRRLVQDCRKSGSATDTW